MRKILTVAFLAISVPAQAQFYDGNGLHEACQSSSQVITGWAAGYVDAISAVNNSIDPNGQPYDYPAFCIPRGVKLSQVRDVICNALDDEPATRDWAAGFLAHNAIIDAWPCP